VPDARDQSDQAVDDRQSALIAFAERLQSIQRACGNPSIRQLVGIMKRRGTMYSRTTINAKLLGESKPSWAFVMAFVDACTDYAGPPTGNLDIEALRVEYGGLIERLGRSTRRSSQEPAAPTGRPEDGQDTELDMDRRLATYASVPISAPLDQLPHTVHGRDGIVATVESALYAGKGSVHVLAGVGGCGKTTVALEVARRNADRLPVYWVSAAEPAVFTAGMRQVAVALGVPESQAATAFLGHQSAVDCVWSVLAEQQSPWLLVIDNADDSRLLLATADGNGRSGAWIRVPRTGTVLITSRDSGAATWGSRSTIHRLDCLGVEEAADLLLDLTGGAGGSRDDARTLAQRLGGLPLALSIAGAYIASTVPVAPWPGVIRDFAAYTAALDAEFTQVIDAQPFGVVGSERDDRHNVARTWELSLDLLEDLGVAGARPLLRLLSAFGPTPIPYLILLDPTELRRSGYIRDATYNSTARALHALATFGLVDLHRPLPGTDDRLGHRVTLHPLVRDTNASLASRIDRPEVAALAITLLANSVDTGRLDTPEDPDVWPWWHILAPHALTLFNQIIDGDAVDADGHTILTSCRIAGLAARHLHTRGLYEQAEQVGRKVLEITGNMLGRQHTDTLVAQHALARILHARGRLEEAESLLRDLLHRRRQTCGDLDPTTLAARYNLARILHARGRLGAAHTELQELLKIRTPVLGAESAPVLSIRHNLASLLQAQGRLDEAEAEFRSVLEISERVLGDKHPRTMATRHGLARTLHARGRADEAREEYLDVLEIRSHVLGPRHPDTLTTRHALAAVLQTIGQLSEAEAELRVVLQLRRNVLGDEHPHTLTTRNKLARVLRAQERFDDARTEYEAVLASRRKVLGDDHPHTENTRQKLAAVNRHLAAEDTRTASVC
jgi:tetratricopeptide (TPR) repeat protein